MKKVILITGGGSGIGAAIAQGLDSEVYDIIICGRKIKKLEKVAKKNLNIYPYPCDVSNESKVKKMFNFVNKKFGRLDVIINCAAVQGEIGRIDKTNPTDWKKTVEINLLGTYLTIKYFLELLLKSNTKKIINFAGGGAFNSFPNYSAYAVSKAGVVRLTENIAEELKELDVKANCVAPGFVTTDIHKQTLRAGKKKAGKKYYDFTVEKLKKGGEPIEMGVECVKFLISTDSGNLTGKTISANFDRWKEKKFRKYIPEINESDLFTSRRINPNNLEEKYKKEKMGKEIIKLYE